MTESLKRQFSRLNFSREVKLDFQDASYFPCQIKNLSLSGMYVYSKFAENDGTSCHVTLTQVGPTSNLTIQAEAKIARQDNDGIAIQFVSMAQDSYMFLQVILLYEAEDPFIIGLEYPDNCPFELTDNPRSSKGERFSAAM